VIVGTSSTTDANLIYDLPSIVHRLDLGAMFPKPQPLEIELGCGDASFLVAYARCHPERNFIGVERLLGRMRKLDRKGRRAGLTNLRGVRIECAYFLEWLVPPGAASALHVYFPDPWPKKKHRARRLVNERFPELARTALTPGGAVFLRTDDADYFDQMEAVFGNHLQFRPAATPPDLAAVRTDFEEEFLARGKQTFQAGFVLDQHHPQ